MRKRKVPCLLPANGDEQTDAILKAAVDGDTHEVQSLLNQNADPHSKNNFGMCALSMAAMFGHVDTTEFLIKVATDTDILFDSLVGAVCAGKIKTTQSLLKCSDTFLTQQDKSGRTLVLHAVTMGHMKTAELLLSRGANSQHEDRKGNFPLLAAVGQRRNDLVRLLLQHKVDVNQTSRMSSFALLKAVQKDHVNIARLLLKNKAAVNQIGKHGMTCLLQACITSDSPMVRLLLNHGANSQPDIHGSTPFHQAVIRNRPAAVLTVLLDNDEHLINQRVGPRKTTALLNAVQRDREPLVKLLLDRKANPNILAPLAINQRVGPRKTTALLNAVQRDRKPVVKLLLDRKADPNILAPLANAVRRKKEPLVKLLLDHKADPNHETPLVEAVLYGYDEIVHLLLRAPDINVNEKDPLERTALVVAGQAARPSIVKLLLDKHVFQEDLNNTLKVTIFQVGRYTGKSTTYRFGKVIKELIHAGAVLEVEQRTNESVNQNFTTVTQEKVRNLIYTVFHKELLALNNFPKVLVNIVFDYCLWLPAC
jgi:ankyrin repeat protein